MRIRGGGSGLTGFHGAPATFRRISIPEYKIMGTKTNSPIEEDRFAALKRGCIKSPG